MKHEYASAHRTTNVLIPTKEELRAATSKGVTLSSQQLVESRAEQRRKARAVRAVTPAKTTGSKQPAPSILQTIATLRAENFRLERELKAARKGEADMLARLQRILGIQGK